MQKEVSCRVTVFPLLFSSFSMIVEFRVKFPLFNYNLFVNILQISASYFEIQNPFYPKKLYFFLLHYSHINCYLCARMTSRYLILFCKKPFYVSAHTCPFRQLRWHLPRVRGRLTFRILFCLGKKSFNTTSKRNSLVPSFLSGGQIRNDDGRKKTSCAS